MYRGVRIANQHRAGESRKDYTMHYWKQNPPFYWKYKHFICLDKGIHIPAAKPDIVTVYGQSYCGMAEKNLRPLCET